MVEEQLIKRKLLEKQKKGKADQNNLERNTARSFYWCFKNTQRKIMCKYNMER